MTHSSENRKSRKILKQKEDSSAAKISDTATQAENKEADSCKEIGGQKGPEPTRYGDWEKNGRCTDF